MKYKFLPHTADIKFIAFGKKLEKCFTNASYALREIICKEEIKSIEKKEIKVKGKDLENLLYNFLEEFLFLLDSENFLLGRIDRINITKKNGTYSLFAKISGDKVNNYETESDVKAITYHEMFVKQDKGKWVCQVVVDV